MRRWLSVTGPAVLGPGGFQLPGARCTQHDRAAELRDAGAEETLAPIPLLNAKTRSAFGMTEPDVASSDATNVATKIDRDGDDYVISGRKWLSPAPRTPTAAS